ncbi:MAG TPA: NAD(P)/FAD-dependent oxidoreductase [Pseudonocardiaceae bacterium]|nr:NAD(P)/FAD-dependent oxidoreductase [Pseudonocardiaceae bacterium]
MARTQLARMIGKMFADRDNGRHFETRQATRHRIRRREFLAMGAAAGAGAVVLGTGAAFPARAMAAQPLRIAIVGAGISGLAAALRLADHGIAATVYEANGRIGGRMFSSKSGSYWDSGQVSEWGGELIDTDHTVIKHLARRFGLPLDDLHAAEPKGSTDTYFFDGQYYPFEQAVADFGPVFNALQKDLDTFTYPVTFDADNTAAGIALSNMTTYEWIETRVPGGHRGNFGKLMDVAYNIEFGAETTQQSSLGMIGLIGFQPDSDEFDIFGTSDERFHIRGGNQQLPRAIAAALPAGTVRHGWRLVSLAVQNDDTQLLTFSSRGTTRTITADHTILAVPLGVMKRIDFSRARFDARKRATYAAMPMGVNGKLQLQFDKRLWNKTGAWPGRSTGQTYADTGYQNTWDVTRAQPGTQGILVDYTGGGIAHSFTPDRPFLTADDPKTAHYARRFLSQIEPVYPGITALWNGKALMSTWYLNPFSFGAYSYWPTHYTQHFAGYEGVRQGNVHFAGEHCSVDFQGYMEGGAEEGRRAAHEIISDLKPS